MHGPLRPLWSLKSGVVGTKRVWLGARPLFEGWCDDIQNDWNFLFQVFPRPPERHECTHFLEKEIGSWGGFLLVSCCLSWYVLRLFQKNIWHQSRWTRPNMLIIFEWDTYRQLTFALIIDLPFRSKLSIHWRCRKHAKLLIYQYYSHFETFFY